MKCPNCDGTGKVDDWDGWSEYTCPVCDGKGWLTNDEWRKTCSAEEFAEWIVSTNRCKKDHLCSVCRQKWCDKKYVVEWLKQPHR